MKKIGFFGGCFNPPTNIHINIANKLIEAKKLDTVIFIPVNDYYQKDNLVNATHRYNMIKLAINKYSNLKVDDIEIKQSKKLFAVDAFKLILDTYSCKYKDAEFYMIMGSDNFDKMPLWKEYEEIKDKYKYIVIDRNKEEISSTQIRDMIKNSNEKITKYISKDVYEYIKENKLYNK